MTGVAGRYYEQANICSYQCESSYLTSHVAIRRDRLLVVTLTSRILDSGSTVSELQDK